MRTLILHFRETTCFQGNFYGVSIYDISDPAKTKLLTSLVCPGGQGDVSVYGNLLFMSVEMPNGRLDCGTQGFPPEPPPAAGHEKEAPSAGSAEGPLSRGEDLRYLRHQESRSRWRRCRHAADRTRIRWSWIRTTRTTCISTCRARRLCVSRKSWLDARERNRTRTRTRRCFAST